MKDVKQIVAANLITLRKQHGLTQNDLAKKLAYSDNMVSRWERAEIAPSIEVLQKISEFYKIPIETLFKEETSTPINEKYEKDLSLKQFSTLLMLVIALWTLITIIFVYSNTFLHKNLWRLFVLGVPLSCLILLCFNGKWATLVYKFVLFTIITWSTLAFTYLQLIKYNFFLVFLIGVPVQLSLVIYTFIKPKQAKQKDEE